MFRENRYIVFKKKDVQAALSRDESATLRRLVQKVDRHRLDNGKVPLVCVVVESDWPEYEPTWQAIERRVDGDGT